MSGKSKIQNKIVQTNLQDSLRYPSGQPILNIFLPRKHSFVSIIFDQDSSDSAEHTSEAADCTFNSLVAGRAEAIGGL